MMEFDKNLDDRYSYPLMPVEDRWIYNKLITAEKLGHHCGPSGTPIDKPGKYVQRAIMNCAGEGFGGVLFFDIDNDLNRQPAHAAGYFWCERFEGLHSWTAFENDLPVDECQGDSSGDRFDFIVRREDFGTPILPPLFQGISKHMQIESIGGKIIEASPRGFPYYHGRGGSYYKRIYTDGPWGNHPGDGAYWYWQVLPKEFGMRAK